MPSLNLLGNNYLESEYSAAELRVLYEAYENDGCTASYIADSLNIDKSYLSRIIRRHEKNGYLLRTVSKEDSRSFHIHLTEKGIEITEDFIMKSNLQIEELIERLDEQKCRKLIDAFDTITEILDECKNNKL